MKTFSVVASATAMVIGMGGAALAYQSASGEPVAEVGAQNALPAHVSVTAADAGFEFRFAPCQPPAKRVGKACVVNVVKTVVLPGTSTSSGASSSSASTSTTSSSGSDEGPATGQATDDDSSATSYESDDEESSDDQAGDDDHDSDDQADQDEQEPNDD